MACRSTAPARLACRSAAPARLACRMLGVQERSTPVLDKDNRATPLPGFARESSTLVIEFHCEHCNKIIKAPEETGGRQGKCPHCQGVNYIPMPREALDEIPLTPIDEDFELRRRRAALEDAAVQQRLLRERQSPGEGGRRDASRRAGPQQAASPSGGAAASGSTLTAKHIASLVVTYVEAMSQGTLEKADEISRKLSRHPNEANRVLDDMLRDDLTAYGLPTLPRPVLLGFLKQLRSRLT